mgnify:CR=1 FL=1
MQLSFKLDEIRVAAKYLLDHSNTSIIRIDGEMGAGKTTLISIICGIVRPSSGKVTVDDFDIIDDYRQTRSRIGLVPQELTLEQFETVFNNVSYSRGLYGKKSKCIIMAVKPNDYKDVCKIIKEDLNKDALVLTVMAGVKLKSLKKELPYNTKFVRLMTNLNIKIFQGSSFIYANKAVKNIDKKRIENYWSSLGTVHWLKTESKIDKFTALIGSGPAYLIYFCECLVMVFKNFGLTEKDAAMHVQQLLLGTALLTYYDDEKFNYLNKKIASKGGTTQEALDILAKGKLTSILNTF